MSAFPASLGWSVIDVALLAYLVIVLPSKRLWAGPSRAPADGTARRPRHGRNILRVGAMLAVLAIDWIATGRAPAALGLAIPPPLAGQIGLAVVAVAIAAVFVTTALSKPIADDKRAAAEARLGEIGLLLHSHRDWPAFVAMVVILGCGWEMLYRGFVLFCLVPVVGVVPAVVVAALAYGLAHNYRERREQVASVVSAFAFTIAYAASGSLWWLILIHTAMPLLPVLFRRQLIGGRAPTVGDRSSP